MKEKLKLMLKDILEHSVSVHLWNSLTYNKHKIDFSKVPQDSLFGKLFNRINK